MKLRSFYIPKKEPRQIHHDEFREIIIRQGFKCKHCGLLDGTVVYKKGKKIILKLTQDHIIPLSKGGGTHKDNIQALCYKCNMKKANNYPRNK